MAIIGQVTCTLQAINCVNSSECKKRLWKGQKGSGHVAAAAVAIICESDGDFFVCLFLW